MRKSTLAILATLLVLGGMFLLMNQSEQTAYIHEIPTNSATIQVGSEAVIPNKRWVKVVESLFIQWFSGSSSKCVVEFGNTITVKEIRSDNLLVEYTTPWNHGGALCQSGVQFIVSKSNFATMSDQYAEARDVIQAEKELVGQLLAQNYYGEEVDAGNLRWVNVVNIVPVVQKFSTISVYLAYGQTCGAGNSYGGVLQGVEGGTIQVRGEANGKVLYEYTARGNPIGTPCPSGVLFFSQN